MSKNTIFRLTLNRGIVIKTTGSWHTVLTGALTVKCRLKGNFRIRGIKNTNPVAVGDEVDLEFTGPDTGLIVGIRDRRNYLIRKATNLSRETHILAANVDQLVLLISLEFPETPLEFVDRFLLSAEAYHIPVILVINKTDLYGAGKMAWCREVRQIYEYAGYPVLEMSVETGSGIDELSSRLNGRFSALAGNSGVGKSSLINRLCPGLNLKTAPISAYHSSGKHTTTYPEMFALPGGGYITDTPGIRGFGIIDISPKETGLYFTDIFRLSRNCQFYNCQHLQEPGCAVTEACRSGILHESRYRSYVKIITGSEDKYRLG